MEYSDIIIKHFKQPLNIGEIKEADGIGEIGDIECGDYFKFFIKVKNNKIVDIKYLVRGCPAAIALCSIVSETVKGYTLGEALGFTDEKAIDIAGGLPETKLHCSSYAAACLHNAVKDHYKKVFLKAGIEI
jgi:nitrogen fixation NifU-like protein